MSEQAAPRIYPRFWRGVGLLASLFVLRVFIGIAVGARHQPALAAAVDLLVCGAVLAWGLRKTGAPAREVFPLRAFRTGLVIATSWESSGSRSSGSR